VTDGADLTISPASQRPRSFTLHVVLPMRCLSTVALRAVSFTTLGDSSLESAVTRCKLNGCRRGALDERTAASFAIDTGPPSVLICAIGGAPRKTAETRTAFPERADPRAEAMCPVVVSSPDTR